MTIFEEFMAVAEGSANLARKYRMAIIDGTTINFLGYPQNRETMERIVKINDSNSYAYYAAARAIREGL
jgi:hypothetical protein